MNPLSGSAQILWTLVRRRKRQVAAFLRWAAAREKAGRSLRWSQRQDIREAAEACALFEQPWWGLVVFTCFGRIEGARFVASRFRRPRPDAARVLASLELPPGSLGHDRAQAGHRGAKLALVSACLRAPEFEEILLRGHGFGHRYERLRAMRASYWGRRGCFDLVLRAGALAIGGQRYGPDRAYLDTAPARGFLEVTGVPLTASSLVLATVQTNNGVYVTAAVPNVPGSSFTIYINRKAPSNTPVGWFIAN